MQIIGLTGLPRSGKDTVGLHMMTNFNFARMAFAAPLKDAAAILLNRSVGEMNGVGFDREAILPEWGFSTRRFLQWFGTEGLRSFDPDFWVKRLEVEMQDLNYKNIAITDVRFENEVAMIRKYGGVLIEVRRPGTTGSAHVSDQGVTLTENDTVLTNDGTRDQLFEKVDQLMTSLGYQQRSYTDWPQV
jgi:hypothetical protein